MKVFIVLGLVAIAISAVGSTSINDALEEWNRFKNKFKKVYNNDKVELVRKNIYLDNMKKIEEHNKLYDAGQVKYKLGMNKFGDLNNEEYNAKMTDYDHLYKKDNDQYDPVIFMSSLNKTTLDAVDWRNQGFVTPVKNQGLECGSCWAFSTTGALEAQYFRKTGTLVSLSEQNLVDCSFWFGNSGCKGGLMSRAFRYIKYNRGIDTADSYPYTGKQEKCKYKSKNKGATVKGFVKINKGDENALKEALATVGPVSVAIDVSSFDFRFYTEGVFYIPDCSTTKVNHAVLAVGYNTTASGDNYWIVKNSWGEAWGNKGYILMARNRQNHCGIATMASYPLV